ncbi:hypothetical protein [Leisingera sp. ANG59]|uniref:hypothetical protein n=1 Tax=Leisingera sp. ANG59 TaxID=2675221 RepID=UPI00157321E3|nr:hypothetical protein [Leisingera sp. ANG59]NSY39068.1 hypothetical protein [Leisingera sp. ANG59]
MKGTGYHDISVEEMSLIGRVITSFSAFEHELLRAIVAMNGAYECPETAPGDFADKFLRVVQGGFGARVKAFVTEYKMVKGEDDFIKEFGKDMQQAVALRDQFAHGVWDKAESGELLCIFFSRAAIKNGYVSTDMKFTVEDLKGLVELNIANSVKIMNMFGTT